MRHEHSWVPFKAWNDSFVPDLIEKPRSLIVKVCTICYKQEEV